MKFEHTGMIHGFALPAVLVISVIIMTLIAMAVSLLSLDNRIYQEYHNARQRRLDLESVLTIYCHDSSIFGQRDSSMLEFDGDEIDIVRNGWGMYDLITASNSCGESIRRLYGRKADSSTGAAFWICDRNRALTLGNDAKIYGTVFIPPNGINYAGDIPEKLRIPETSKRISSADMPPLDCSFHKRVRQVSETDRQDFPVIEASEDDSTFMLNGMGVLRGDKIIISGKSVLHDVIISARKVIVRTGFKGCIQIFCTDSVRLEPDVRLEWPSGICVTSGSGRPHVELCGGSGISGYVAVTGAEDDPELRFPGYEQHRGATLDGLLYADCSCNIDGNINGAAYVRDCYHMENGIKFPGTLANARISRSERLAFPILMEGEHTRKAIKNMK